MSRFAHSPLDIALAGKDKTMEFMQSAYDIEVVGGRGAGTVLAQSGFASYESSTFFTTPRDNPPAPPPPAATAPKTLAAIGATRFGDGLEYLRLRYMQAKRNAVEWPENQNAWLSVAARVANLHDMLFRGLEKYAGAKTSTMATKTVDVLKSSMGPIEHDVRDIKMGGWEPSARLTPVLAAKEKREGIFPLSTAPPGGWKLANNKKSIWHEFSLRLQEVLNDLGYNAGGEDGWYGKTSHTAMVRARAANAALIEKYLGPNGIPNNLPELIKALLGQGDVPAEPEKPAPGEQTAVAEAKKKSDAAVEKRPADRKKLAKPKKKKEKKPKEKKPKEEEPKEEEEEEEKEEKKVEKAGFSLGTWSIVGGVFLFIVALLARPKRSDAVADFRRALKGAGRDGMSRRCLQFRRNKDGKKVCARYTKPRRQNLRGSWALTD
ncbi:MAG: hypothetical protein ABIE42_09205 [Candidatus Eisenbacteria bacterium]